MKSAIKILLVEDDSRIRSETMDALRAVGHEVEVAIDLQRARAASQNAFDLILLDLGLPDGDGLDLCRELRRAGRSVPIIVLTARDTPEDRVRGLDVGADDYVVKPFHMPELVARVRTILRRAGRVLVGSGSGASTVQLGELWADPELRHAGRGEEQFTLRRREFDLLLFLLGHPFRPWTREQLLDRVWGADYDGDHRTVDIHVRRLRAMIEKEPGVPTYLLTEWGVGYRMVAPEGDRPA